MQKFKYYIILLISEIDNFRKNKITILQINKVILYLIIQSNMLYFINSLHVRIRMLKLTKTMSCMSTLTKNHHTSNLQYLRSTFFNLSTFVDFTCIRPYSLITITKGRFKVISPLPLRPKLTLISMRKTMLQSTFIQMSFYMLIKYLVIFIDALNQIKKVSLEMKCFGCFSF